jgi:hypothetical protein
MLGWFGWFLQLECIIGPCVLAYNALTCVITDQMNQCYTTQDIPADNYRDSGGSEIRLHDCKSQSSQSFGSGN